MWVVIVILLLIISLIFQTFPQDLIALGGIRPDLIFIVVICLSLVRGAKEGVFIGLGGGILKDLASGLSGSACTLSLTISGLLAGLLKDFFFKENILVPLFVVLFGTVIKEIIFFLTVCSLGLTLDAGRLKLILLPEIALNCLLTLPIYWGIRKMERRWEVKG
ncbi:MAG: rod shape-determining protein MreD [Armatimonadetes bacterium CG07_land_8_20_14_0_80_40_9]|nr:MAG: rod shape-determining protein MreD [Armatimonadetes bacterium CG07_land_8_20_14_0_80_40_9]